jgi:hypothetical protein
VLFVLPGISDDLTVDQKNGLAIRNATNVAGRCPVCGCEGELFTDREHAGVLRLLFRHEDDCPATRDPEAA